MGLTRCCYCLPMQQNPAARLTLQDIVQVQERLLIVKLIINVSLRRCLRRRLPLPAGCSTPSGSVSHLYGRPALKSCLVLGVSVLMDFHDTSVCQKSAHLFFSMHSRAS